jgi:membrane fusion protein (multidrug efflux system)
MAAAPSSAVPKQAHPLAPALALRYSADRCNLLASGRLQSVRMDARHDADTHSQSRNFRMIKRLVVALVLIAVVAGGLIGFNLFRAKMISDFFANQQMPAVTVSAVVVEPTTWTPEIEAIGTLIAASGVDVAAQTAGVVKSIAFEANEDVEEGELLVQIDDAVERADLLSARATFERDRAQLERARTLSNRGVSSEASLEEAQAAVAVSESALARIKATLDLKAIEAPFGGVIGIPRVDVGEYVQPGTVIATLQQLDTMKVDFTVPEQHIAQLAIGQPAVFGVQEGEFRFDGTITGIDPKVDPATRLVSVRAEVGNPEGELRPGQFVRVRIQLPPVEDVIALPQTSVITSLFGDYVYVVEEAAEEEPAAEEGPAEQPAADAEPAAGASPQTESESAPPPASTPPALVARQVFVELGARQGSMIAVAEGLSAGQTVVTSGQNKLANNAPVVINNSVDPAKVALDGEAARP